MASTTAAAPPTIAVIHCEEFFDIDAAGRAWEQIAHADPAADVMLDFSKTRVLQDVAFSALLESVSRLGRRVRTRGMARHHEALRRYIARAVVDLSGRDAAG